MRGSGKLANKNYYIEVFFCETEIHKCNNYFVQNEEGGN
jgi:hypothetical protein